ncbi:hypothetical protein LCGC14_2505920 [marine sediment metagenome]|uniref:Phage nucleotide-binding protein n=1 Tax=marine sediment metagenome TaxID=412755 RepID=A0A0F9B190_9ZZZZ
MTRSSSTITGIDLGTLDLTPRKLSEAPPYKPRSFLLYGFAGVGKTLSAETWPEEMKIGIIDHDVGVEVLGNNPRIEVWDCPSDPYNIPSESYIKTNTILDELISGKQQVDVLYMDSATTLQDIFMSQVIYKNKYSGRLPDGDMYRLMQKEVNNFIAKGLAAAEYLVWTAHVKEMRDVVGATHYAPAFSGQQAMNIMCHFGEFYHCDVVGSGEERSWLWRTQPDKLYIARSRIRGLPLYVEPNFESLITTQWWEGEHKSLEVGKKKGTTTKKEDK